MEYDTREEAERARVKTNGLRVFGKPLVCHFAEEKVQVKNDAPVEVLRSRIAGEGGSSAPADSAGAGAGEGSQRYEPRRAAFMAMACANRRCGKGSGFGGWSLGSRV